MQTTTPLASQFADRVIALHPGAETRVDGPYVTAGSPSATDTASLATSGRRESNRAPVGTSQERLRSIVSQIERLEIEKKVIADDISEIYKGAGSEGFDVNVIRSLVAERKKDPEKVQVQYDLLDLYREVVNGGNVSLPKNAAN